MADLSVNSYRFICTPEQRASFRQNMESAGYYAFFAFVEEFRAALKAYTDDEIHDIGELLARARVDFPHPGRFSPSWDKLWDELDQLFVSKNEVLSSVSAVQRDGEWQVLLDNPYSSQQVVCYPSLSFVDAAYLYAYFQKDLKPNEVLRLQKITHLIVKTGNRQVSLLPDV